MVIAAPATKLKPGVYLVKGGDLKSAFVFAVLPLSGGQTDACSDISIKSYNAMPGGEFPAVATPCAQSTASELQAGPPSPDDHGQLPSKATQVSAPKLVAPGDGEVLSNFPRTTNLIWVPVPAAISYTVEIEFGNSTDGWSAWKTQEGITGNLYTFDFIGKSSGRWRAWAVVQGGNEGDKSPWREFTYRK